MTQTCRVCTKEYDRHEVTQLYGIFFAEGFCKPYCYTQHIMKQISPEEKKLKSNMALINTCELDDFDKLVVIKGWFNHFTDGQKENLIKILEEMKNV